MIRALAVLLAGELRLLLRQPTSVLVFLLLPALGLPWGLRMMSADRPQRAPVAVQPAEGVQLVDDAEGERAVLRIAAPPEVYPWLRPRDRLEVMPDGVLAREGPTDVVAEVVIDGGRTVIRYRPELPASVAAHERLLKASRRHGRQEVAALLEAVGAPVGANQTLVVQTQEVAVPPTPPRRQLGGTLAVMVVVLTVLTASNVATDTITNEKERGTLETLLTAGVPRRAVVLAKASVTAGATVLSLWIGLLGLAVALRLGFLPPSLASAFGALDGGSLALLLAVTTLLGLQVTFAGLLMASALPDFKAVSMLSIPVTLVLLMLASVGVTQVPLHPLLACVPVTNLCLVLRDLFQGELSGGLTGLALVATVGHLGLGLSLTERLFGREATIVGADSSTARRRLGYHGRDAAALFAVTLLLVWVFGQMAQSLHLIGGMVFTQVVLIGGLAVAAVGFLGLPARDTLSLHAPRPVDLGLAVVAGLCAPAIGVAIGWLQAPFLPVPRAFLEEMGRVTLTGHPLVVPLLVFAVLPAVCEELLFRGALLGLLRRTLPPVPRALAVAVAFGLVHFAIVRFLPTATLGLLMTVAVLRSGSLAPAVVIHLLNNALILIAIRSGSSFEPHPALVGAGALVAAGAVAAMGRTRGPGGA